MKLCKKNLRTASHIGKEYYLLLLCLIKYAQRTVKTLLGQEILKDGIVAAISNLLRLTRIQTHVHFNQQMRLTVVVDARLNYTHYPTNRGISGEYKTHVTNWLRRPKSAYEVSSIKE